MARRGGKLGQAVLDLLVDDSQFTSGLDRNQKKAQSWTANLNRDVKRGLAQGIGIGGGLMVANAVASGVGMVKDVVAGSINAAMEWESAFAGVRKTVDASEEEFADLSGAIRGMAKEIPIGSTELAGLAEAAGALGVAKDDIMEFTRVTALIGTTTDVSSDQAATSLGQLSNVLGLTSQDYEKFGSTLVDLGNKGASTESQILEIASRAGAGSKLIGMATDETLAWASSVANLGIEVEAGGSALQKFFLDTAKSVSEGGEELETYGRIAGMTASEFKRAFEDDATGALQTFLAGLGELSQGEQLQALSDLDFNDVRITRTLLGLANNTDMVAASLDTASDAWKQNTALAAEAEKRFGTTESKMQILGNRVNDLAVTFGDDLLPALVDLATLGVRELELFAEAVGDTTQMIGYSTQVVAGHFGDMGDATNALADEMDEDFGVVNDAVARFMSETGASFEEALETVRLYGTGNATALIEAEQAWEDYTKQTSTALGGVVTNVEAGMTDAELALLAGEEGIDTAAGTALDGISAEAAKQRDDAISAMKAMLGGISSLFETDTSLRDSWQALIDRMDDPYSEAERKADIFSENTILAIRGAIQSGDPDIVADSALLVENMLGQIATMEPGALESGEAVPPAIRDGMDASMQQLIDWIELTLVPAGLDSLTMDEADEIGIGNIWRYAEGMRSNQQEAIDAAANIAKLAEFQLHIDAGGGGWSIIESWIGGMENAYINNQGRIWGVVDGVKRSLGGSLPTEGPLKGGAGSGGQSIGESWINALAGSLDPALVNQALRGVAGAMALDSFGLPTPTMPGLDLLSGTYGAAASGTSAGSPAQVTEYHLHYTGRELTFNSREAFMAELEGLATFNEGRLG
jgi:TP901 family phage tail tape measure protein